MSCRLSFGKTPPLDGWSEGNVRWRVNYEISGISWLVSLVAGFVDILGLFCSSFFRLRHNS